MKMLSLASLLEFSAPPDPHPSLYLPQSKYVSVLGRNTSHQSFPTPGRNRQRSSYSGLLSFVKLHVLGKVFVIKAIAKEVPKEPECPLYSIRYGLFLGLLQCCCFIPLIVPRTISYILKSM